MIQEFKPVECKLSFLDKREYLIIAKNTSEENWIWEIRAQRFPLFQFSQLHKEDQFSVLSSNEPFQL